MDRDQLYDEASKVSAENGEVILDGPDSVDVRVTPEAAEKTADDLIENAVKARGQRRLAGLLHQPDNSGKGGKNK